MAEVLGVVASGISVAQLAGQLLGCVQKLRAFSRALRTVSQDLEDILNEVQILGQILYEVEDLSGNSSQSLGAALAAALQQCRSAVATLELLVAKSKKSLGSSASKRPYRAVVAVLRKEEVLELKGKMESAKSLLHLAVTCHSISIQKRHVELIQFVNNVGSHTALVSRIPTSGVRQDVDLNTSLPSIRYIPHVENPTRLQKQGNSRTIRCSCRCHALRSLQGGFWKAKFPKGIAYQACDKCTITCTKYKKASVWISLRGIGIAYALIARFEFLLGSRQSKINPSLEAIRIVGWDSPVFALIQDARLQQTDFSTVRSAMVDCFTSGRASPWDVFPNGKSVPEILLNLPWQHGNVQLQLLEFLVHSGIDLNKTEVFQSSSRWKGLGPWNTGLDNAPAAHKHLLNRLIALGLDLSRHDQDICSDWPTECSPTPVGNYKVDDDPFFVEWIAEGAKVCPDFAGINGLQGAVLTDSTEAVRDHIIKRPNSQGANALRQSVVHLAVWRPQHLQLLLDAGYDVNKKDINGRTPLMYAAAVGATTTAIALLRAGADPWVKDSLHANHGFIEYAARSGHWQFLIEIFDMLRHSTLFSDEDVRDLLTYTIVVWAGAVRLPQRKQAACYEKLLAWGADPEVRFRAKSDWRKSAVGDSTLLHCVSTIYEFEALIASGFQGFNHQNSDGANALMRIVEWNDPQMIRRAIECGCDANNQDRSGRTALHVIAELRWESFVYKPWDDWDIRVGRTECVGLLLDKNAKSTGDYCHCACSLSGCSPGHILLKEHARYLVVNHATQQYPLGQYITMLIWLRVLQYAGTSQLVKDCVLELLRFVRFEELGLTHTCCRRWSSYCFGRWENLDEDEVTEIRDEEEELINQLDFEMLQEECDLSEDLEAVAISALRRLIQLKARKYIPRRSNHEGSKELKIIRVRDVYDLTSVMQYSEWARQRATRVPGDWFDSSLRWIKFFEEIMDIPVEPDSDLTSGIAQRLEVHASYRGI